MNEPLWRRVLCWGVVITYLTLPLLVMTLYIIGKETPDFHFEEYAKNLTFIKTFYETITALAFGLSGLHSFDRFIQLKNGKKE